MKKSIIIILMVCVQLLTGCGGTLSDSETNSSQSVKNNDEIAEKKTVVFSNRLDDIWDDASVRYANEISCSGYEKASDNALYAFCVYYYYSEKNNDNTKTGLQARAEKVAQNMRELGLVVLEDYPYCYYYDGEMLLSRGYCTVIGTIDELKELFDDTQPFESGFYRLYPATRPDMISYIKESGWKVESGVSIDAWYSRNEETIEQLLGEDKQIALEVKVY